MELNVKQHVIFSGTRPPLESVYHVIQLVANARGYQTINVWLVIMDT